MSIARRLAAATGLALLAAALLAPAAAQADFGIESASVIPENEGGTLDTQAGSHPFGLKVKVDMNLNADAEESPQGTLRTLSVELPPGLLGNPSAAYRCPRALYEGIFPHCPPASQIGFAHVGIAGLGVAESAVFNISPPLGRPAMLGFSVDNINSFIEATVRSDSDYGITAADLTIPTSLPIQWVEVTTWGVPASEAHRPERVCPGKSLPSIGGPTCAAEIPPAPFLSLPTSCGKAPLSTVEVTSLEEPDRVLSVPAPFEEAGQAFGLDGCNAEEFKPSISAQPTTNRADSPSGLEFDLHQPQNEDPEDLSTAHLKDTTVTLPAGLSVNPSSANGLGACSLSQIGFTGKDASGLHFSEAPQSCPDASKLGTLTVKSPPLAEFDATGKPFGPHPLQGSVFIAKPFDNPFGSLLAIYLAVEDPLTGIVAKLAGKVEPDPNSGQLKTTFVESPQLPLEDVELHIFAGARAALRTPLACGAHTTTSTLVPWSTPEGQDAHPSDSFQITQPAGGSGPCPSSEAQAPNSPSFTAGTIAPAAGAYSPFVLKLTRPDGSQQLAGIDTVLPKGLTGKLAGIATCSEAQLAGAKSREAPNKGVLEQQSPSCPASSEVGTVTVGAGAGPSPFYATGHAYLAGPYKGAPLSLAIITPAVAGPFDLGAVLVRAALFLNPETAQITARSDPIPALIEGIPLDVRSIALNMGRPAFTLNPTNCNPAQVLGSAISTLGGSAVLASPFQVGGCNALPYQPTLTTRLTGPTKRGKFPALTAILKAKPGEANSSRVSVTLPRSEFLEQGHFGTICTRVQFAAKACPEKSIYGSVKVLTPLLDYPLEGPVYLRSSNHNLPDLVLALRGPASQPLEFTLDGRIDSVHRGIRTSFEGVPDAPFTEATLTMPGGKKGLLVNSTNVCAQTNRSNVQMDGQNGKVHDFKPALLNAKCAKAKKHAKHKRKAGHR